MYVVADVVGAVSADDGQHRGCCQEGQDRPACLRKSAPLSLSDTISFACCFTLSGMSVQHAVNLGMLHKQHYISMCTEMAAH